MLQLSLVKIDHEIYSTIILSLGLFQKDSWQFLEKNVQKYWSSGLEDWACPGNVWLGKLTTLNMIINEWLGG